MTRVFFIGRAVIKTDNAAATLLNKAHDLVRTKAHRNARKQNTRSLGVAGRLSFISQPAHFLVGKEGCFKGNFHQFHAGNRRGTALRQIHDSLERQPFTVHQCNGFVQFGIGDTDAEFLFKAVHQSFKLLAPVGQGVAVLNLRQLQQGHRFVWGKQLIHLFLAVTGGVGHHNVCGRQIGAAVRNILLAAGRQLVQKEAPCPARDRGPPGRQVMRVYYFDCSFSGAEALSAFALSASGAAGASGVAATGSSGCAP